MPRARLVSLDAFRGLTIAAMIVVNNPAAEASRYRILRHAPWNGCRPADVIFPAFLFIAGVSLTLSLAARRAAGDSPGLLRGNLLRRACILFGLGLLLNALPYFDWEIVRVPGVLQRLALAYLGAGLIALRWGPTGQAAVGAVLLLLYWGLLVLVPVPGYGPGVLAPHGNLGAYIDRLVLATHMAHREWDPEGLLGTMPAIASVLAGTVAGCWIQANPSAPARITWGIGAAGVAAMLLGLAIDPFFPINKSLWSSSYVLFTAGASALAFAVCFWLVDIRAYRRWTTPFLVFGTNPILAYWLSAAVAKLFELIHVVRWRGSTGFLETYLVDAFDAPFGSRPLAALLYALAYTGLWLLLLFPLYRRRIFVKI